MITVKELTKRYGAHTAVDALSFTVDKGQIYGLLGPNGAGKSTTMNIITGYISATDGTAEIDGCDIFDSPAEARAKIGYLPEQPPLYTDMTPREYLAFAAELKGLPREQRKAAVEQCMERTNIADVADRLIRNLSKGYRQRVGLACALLGDPPVIILDEPTVGLDPKQIIEIRELIRSLGQEHTVLLSSHILSEVNAVCDKVLIMSHGKLVACDTPENLTAHHGAGNAGGGAGRAVPAVGAGSAGCRICSLRRRKRRHGPHRLLWRRGSARTGGHCAGGRGPGRAAHGRRNNKPGGCVPGADRGRAGGR